MVAPALSPALYRLQEAAFRTQYAELKERARAAGPLLPGTPGTLYDRTGTGTSYCYRVYYPVPSVQAELLIGRSDDTAAVEAARDAIAFARWMAEQVGHLRRLGFQVADKATARVLVELHNRGWFEAGLVVVGTLAYMASLNELGCVAVASRTQDVDLARRQRLGLAAPQDLAAVLQETRLRFNPVPGLPSQRPSTSFKLAGREGLRLDLLAPGRHLGDAVPVPELGWHAQAVPHYDYLLDGAEPAVLLAGGHAVPVRVPRVERFFWHKLYAAAARDAGNRDKADKDLTQAATLAALVVEEGAGDAALAKDGVPPPILQAARRMRARMLEKLGRHPQTADAIRSMLD